MGGEKPSAGENVCFINFLELYPFGRSKARKLAGRMLAKCF